MRVDCEGQTGLCCTGEFSKPILLSEDESTVNRIVLQTAWIQNGTLRDNITFGRPFVLSWYTKVVYACALR